MNNIAVRTNQRWDGMVRHLGYVPVSVSHHDGTITDIELIEASQNRLRKTQIIPDVHLTSRQRVHLKLARAITKEVCCFGTVVAVHAAIIPPASDQVRTAGMYSRTTREVYIASEQLEYGRSTIDTVIHEIAHHTSGAEDLEEGHSRAMTYVAARVVELTAARTFDEELKGAEW